MRAALILLLALPAHAAGNAGPATPEGPYITYVQVEEVLGVVALGSGDMGQVLTVYDDGRTLPPGQWCGINVDCGGWIDGPIEPDVAPVPLPATLYLLTAAIAALIWRRLIQ